MGFWIGLRRRAAALMGAALLLAAAPGPAWTPADRAGVLGAAQAAVDAAANPSAKAAMMVQLARRLQANGDTPAAIQEAGKAGTAFGTDPDLASVAPLTDAMALLVQFGAPQAAQALAGIAGPPAVQAELLAALGKIFAASHDTNGLAATIATLRALSEVKRGDTEDTADAKTLALADIGTAMAENGQTDAALDLAKSLPPSGPRLRLQAEIAFALCQDGPTRQGAAVAAQAADALNHPATGDAALVTGGATFATAAAAACEGAEAGRKILDTASQNPAMTREAAVTLLENAGLGKAADALAPDTGTSGAIGLAEAARRKLDHGDRAGAQTLALKAAQEAARMDGQRDQLAALTGLFHVLTALGDYDEALAAVKPMNLASRRGFSLNVVHTAIVQHDAASVRRTVPQALALMTTPSPFENVARNQLADMAAMLARAGYRTEAEAAFKALTLPNDDDDAFFAGRYAVAQAALGDAAGALKMAEASGPLVTAQDPGQGADAMPGQDLAALAGAAGRKPPEFRPGPQAEALSAIAGELADAGQIEAAQRAAAKLDAGLPAAQKPALANERDGALAAIAQAQIRAGSPHEALATCLRITAPNLRFGPLLALLALPVKA